MNINEFKTKIFKETLQADFDINAFRRFLQELLIDVNLQIQDNKINPPEKFSHSIKFYNFLGSYNISDSQKIALFAICLNNLDSRSTQRNFLRTLSDYNNSDAALAAFYVNDSPEKWRLSLVMMDYAQPKGFNINHAKRFSFLVGRGEPSHTAQERLLPIFLQDNKPSFDDLIEAFNVEPVTDEFFLRYKSKYESLKNFLDSLDSRPDNFDSQQFAKKLLGQIAFLYFVQKKGWLGVKRGDSWLNGSKTFLRDLFNKCLNAHKNYFRDYLEPLFYEGLNKNRGQDSFFQELDCRIPFLNGGLFEGEKSNFTLPNEIFSDESNNGVLDIFDNYNFTISEDEPLEHEIAIDPEMLGKVFESLMDSQNRKNIGAFYTPREIVHYMCQESLISHISAKTGLNDDDLRNFFMFGEILSREEINPQILSRLNEIDSALENVKIVDLAVGSGAFPLGMLNEIISARNIISQFTGSHKNFYELKRNTIKNSIFACDIEPSAVDIAKLRLWLSLVIDNESSEPHPLPNLDCNIICADSLIDSFMGLKLDDENKFTKISRKNRQATFFDDDVNERTEKLITLQKILYDANDPDEKKRIRSQIAEIYDEIIISQIDIQPDNKRDERLKFYQSAKNLPSKPFLLWQMTFPRVFAENGGFDIVIGNPPYINVVRMNDEKRAILFKDFKTCIMRTDLYIAFIEKGCSLLAPYGTLSFIIPHSYTSQDYAELSRKMLLDNFIIDEIVDTSNYFVFKSANVKNIILRISNKPKFTRVRIAMKRDDFRERKFNEFAVNQDFFAHLSAKQFRINISERAIPIKSKIDAQSVKFGNICLIASGIRLNTKDSSRKKNYYLRDEYEEGLKPFIEGRNIQRYYHEQCGWLKYCPDEHYNPMFPELFENEKIMFINVVSERLRFSYDDKNLYNCNTIIDCVRIDKLHKAKHRTAEKICESCKDFDFVSQYDMKFLLGILNARLINWYFFTFISDGLHCYTGDAQSLPIIDLRKKNINQSEIINLVSQVIALKSQNKSAQELDSKIDRLVYELYGLTESEIAIIEGHDE